MEKTKLQNCLQLIKKLNPQKLAENFQSIINITKALLN
jgi:hypothetical protein